MKINCSNGLDVTSFFLDEEERTLYQQSFNFEGEEQPVAIDPTAKLADLINPEDDFSGLISRKSYNGYVFIDPIDGRWTLRIEEEYNDIHNYTVGDLINFII